MTTKPSPTPSYVPVDASPVKSFFVSMLTRDIRLEDAILDLLDNCVDGILRTRGHKKDVAHPYSGYWANIEFNKDMFTISDNCGGIPWSLHEYAFKMGRDAKRSDDAPGSVGVYGIGMKRAIFKMGEECLIWTQNGASAYEVEIIPEWVHDENDWHIPVKKARRAMAEDGTTLMVGKLHAGIAARFGTDKNAFAADLERIVATHYAFIIDKGFTVTINKKDVKPSPTKLVLTKTPVGKKSPVIQPFMFTTTIDGVSVFLAVGFTRPIPSLDEAAAEQEETRYSSLGAGWTILCNDRAVLYCDRTELTGWGEAGIPRYHNQFIAISGIVEFRADDPGKLPTTTTKRGIDASSRLFLQIKNKMREGMALFIDYTNKWKGRAEESRKQIDAGLRMNIHELKCEAQKMMFRTTNRSVPHGKQFKPNLPMPKTVDSKSRHISFVKSAPDVQAVAEHLFDDAETSPSAVGEKCFDLILKESRK